MAILNPFLGSPRQQSLLQLRRKRRRWRPWGRAAERRWNYLERLVKNIALALVAPLPMQSWAQTSSGMATERATLASPQVTVAGMDREVPLKA